MDPFVLNTNLQQEKILINKKVSYSCHVYESCQILSPLPKISNYNPCIILEGIDLKLSTTPIENE